MRDHELYATILGLKAPWSVTNVDLQPSKSVVEVHVEALSDSSAVCPDCKEVKPRHDHRERKWRHLDTCQYQTILVAKVPRVRCEEHGVQQVQVPWADPRSGFTSLFEALAITWLKEANLSAVARLLAITWDEADGIMQRAVRRGLARRGPHDFLRIGIDETSFQKRHEYVTVVHDIDSMNVVHVADGRKKAVVNDFYESLSTEQLEAIDVVTMDMCPAFINSTLEHVPGAKRKIAFDKFHVAKALGDAVDTVRRQEHRELMKIGDHSLVGSKHLWLQNPDNIDEVMWDSTFAVLKNMALRTAKAWGYKEHAMSLWGYKLKSSAEVAWKKWLHGALRTALQPVKKAAKMIKKHLFGILNAIVLEATNAGAESINAKIQKVKRMACGFRNRERFRNAIYFHCGGLDLYPATHTNS